MTPGRLGKFKVIAMVIGAFLAIVAILAWFFPGHDSTYVTSFFSWTVRLPMTLVAWAALEWTGYKLLSLPFWEKMSSAGRIALLVSCIVAVLAAIVLTLHLIGANPL